MSSILIVLAFAICLCIIGIFSLCFELRRPNARELMVIVIMVVIASLGRIIFSFIPQVQPVTVIVIIMGACFGMQNGFITGMLCAVVSNIFLGQGPWTLFQMLAWGMVGCIAGLLAKWNYGRNVFVLSIYSFFAAFLFSMITDIWTVASLGENITLGMVLTTFGTGIAFNLSHAIGNVILCLMLYPMIKKKFDRLRIKYGVGQRRTGLR